MAEKERRKAKPAVGLRSTLSLRRMSNPNPKGLGGDELAQKGLSSALSNTVIGVVALQGAFKEHCKVITSLGAQAREVKLVEDFEGLHGIILPGGESTAMALIGERWGIFSILKDWVMGGKPIWGTCAGMILLCNSVVSAKEGGQALVGGLDVEVCRNYFGSQIQSHEQMLHISAIGEDKPYSAVFIRAPAITSVYDEKVEVLARVKSKPCNQAQKALKGNRKRLRSDEEGSDDDIMERDVVVAARKENILVTAFHPELTNDVRWHFYFLKEIVGVEELHSKTITQ